MDLPPNSGVEIISSDDLPSAFFPTSQHRWKYLRIDPLEDILYLVIGHPCNGSGALLFLLVHPLL